MFSPTDRLDDEKAAVTIKRLNSLLSKSLLEIIDNSNIGHNFLGMYGLHLNEHGAGELALSFVKRIRSFHYRDLLNKVKGGSLKNQSFLKVK